MLYSSVSNRFLETIDSTEHSVLLGKLLSYGFEDWFVVWLHSFLSGRTQQVRINSSVSSSLAVIRGILQGAVLGPFAFVLFTNDLRPIDETNMSVVKYADDQTWPYIVKYGGTDESASELAAFASWCEEKEM